MATEYGSGGRTADIRIDPRAIIPGEELESRGAFRRVLRWLGAMPAAPDLNLYRDDQTAFWVRLPNQPKPVLIRMTQAALDAADDPRGVLERAAQRGPGLITLEDCT